MSTHKDHENEIRAEIHEAGLVGWILGYIAGEIRVLDTKQVDAALKLLNKVCSDAVQQVQAAALENVSLKVDEREPTLEDWQQQANRLDAPLPASDHCLKSAYQNHCVIY
jgi:hypothetical protein